MNVNMEHWSYYGTDKLQLVPYMPGTPVYQDGTLPALYYWTKEEDKISKTFHEDNFNLGKFIAYFEKIKTLQVLCEVRDNKDLVPVGYSWVENPIGVDGARAVTCGFCFLNESSKTAVARDLAYLGLAYWFHALRIDVVHGAMLADNIGARNFAAKLGFEETAIVPNWRYVDQELVSIRTMMLTKEAFIPVFEKWREENPCGQQ